MLFAVVSEPLLVATVVGCFLLSEEMSTLNTPRSLSFSPMVQNSICGFLFAWMARRRSSSLEYHCVVEIYGFLTCFLDFDVCSKKAAVWAGLTYGFITTIRDFLFILIRGPTCETISAHGTGIRREGSNNFGSYVIDDPFVQVPYTFRANSYQYFGQTRTTSSYSSSGSSSSWNYRGGAYGGGYSTYSSSSHTTTTSYSY